MRIYKASHHAFIEQHTYQYTIFPPSGEIQEDYFQLPEKFSTHPQSRIVDSDELPKLETFDHGIVSHVPWTYTQEYSQEYAENVLFALALRLAKKPGLIDKVIQGLKKSVDSLQFRAEYFIFSDILPTLTTPAAVQKLKEAREDVNLIMSRVAQLMSDLSILDMAGDSMKIKRTFIFKKPYPTPYEGMATPFEELPAPEFVIATMEQLISYVETLATVVVDGTIVFGQLLDWRETYINAVVNPTKQVLASNPEQLSRLNTALKALDNLNVRQSAYNRLDKKRKAMTEEQFLSVREKLSLLHPKKDE